MFKKVKGRFIKAATIFKVVRRFEQNETSGILTVFRYNYVMAFRVNFQEEKKSEMKLKVVVLDLYGVHYDIL